MRKNVIRIILTIITINFCFLTASAQDGSNRFEFFFREGKKLMDEGKFDQAKAKFEGIKEHYKSSIPKDIDIDELIRKCTTIDFSEAQLYFDAKDSMKKCITVKSNAKSIKVINSEKWCKASYKGGKIYVTCTDNNNPKSRNASITVVAESKRKSFNVTQLGGRLQFKVEPSTVSFPQKGDTARVSITTNASVWRVDIVPDWIEVEAKENTLILKSTQNNATNTREAEFYIIAANETFPVSIRQDGADTLLIVDKKELVFPFEEASDGFIVNSNIDNWELESSDFWIMTRHDLDSVKVIVKENTSLFSRHGHVGISAGSYHCDVLIHQKPHVSDMVLPSSEIRAIERSGKDSVCVKSNPSDLRVSVISDAGNFKTVTPFQLPIDYRNHTLLVGFERREVLCNDNIQEVIFEPGLRFATITWSPKAAIGMMSGFVGVKSFGAYTHFQVNTPFISDFVSGEQGIAGYNMTFGLVYQPKQFPYVGAFVGLGMGAYAGEPHIGIDYEGGVMGFYKNAILTIGFHTSRVNSSIRKTSFMVGVGGYLKRYYDSEYGFCASDSRRWISVNYVFRPAENGKGLMVSDLGRGKARAYVKALYLRSQRPSDSTVLNCIEPGAGLVFTPVNGLIDMCVGISGILCFNDDEKQFHGIGAEVGAILNLWRIPLTVMLHETDLFGNRHLCVDFGIGFHLGEFEKSKCSYQ